VAILDGSPHIGAQVTSPDPLSYQQLGRWEVQGAEALGADGSGVLEGRPEGGAPQAAGIASPHLTGGGAHRVHLGHMARCFRGSQHGGLAH